MATLVKAALLLRSNFNTLWPHRDKASDGWIGDSRHSAGTSDHNPTRPNPPGWVHAIDVDKGPNLGLPMQTIVDHIVGAARSGKTPLNYVIFNRRIYESSRGWPQEGVPYHGANPHDKHAHFSFDHTAFSQQYFDWRNTLLSGTVPSLVPLLNPVGNKPSPVVKPPKKPSQVHVAVRVLGYTYQDSKKKFVVNNARPVTNVWAVKAKQAPILTVDDRDELVGGWVSFLQKETGWLEAWKRWTPDAKTPGIGYFSPRFADFLAYSEKYKNVFGSDRVFGAKSWNRLGLEL